MGNGDVKCRNVCIFLPCLTSRTTIRIKLINPNKGQTKTRIVLSGFHVSPLSEDYRTPNIPWDRSQKTISQICNITFWLKIKNSFCFIFILVNKEKIQINLSTHSYNKMYYHNKKAFIVQFIIISHTKK